MNALSTGLSAAVLVGVAAGLLIRGPARPPRPAGAALSASRAVAGVATATLGAGLVVLDGRSLVLALLGGAVLAAGSREVLRRSRSAAAGRRAAQVLAACEGLASELRAGQPPVVALAGAVEDWPELAGVAAAGELGADVPASLRALADRPGAGQARVVAAAWQVGHRTGAGLASVLAAAAAQLRADRATARLIATELAAAQATARLLAVLPLGVLLLGGGLGGDPLGFLFGTTPGVVCLSAGLTLEYLGTVWLARIGERVLER